MNLMSIIKPEKYTYADYFLTKVKPSGAAETIGTGGSIVYNGATAKNGRIVLASGSGYNTETILKFIYQSFIIDNWSKVTVEFLGIALSSDDVSKISFSAGVWNGGVAEAIRFSRDSGNNQQIIYNSIHSSVTTTGVLLRPLGWRSDLKLEITPTSVEAFVYGASLAKTYDNIPVGAVLYPYLRVINMETSGGVAKTLQCDGIVLTFEP